MASADITLAALFDARRAARLVQFHAEDAANPSFNEVINDVLDVVTKREPGYRGAITRGSARLTATHLMDLAANRDADPQVRAEASEGLRRFIVRLNDGDIADDAELAHRHALRDDITRFLDRPDRRARSRSCLKFRQARRSEEIKVKGEMLHVECSMLNGLRSITCSIIRHEHERNIEIDIDSLPAVERTFATNPHY